VVASFSTRVRAAAQGRTGPVELRFADGRVPFLAESRVHRSLKPDRCALSAITTRRANSMISPPNALLAVAGFVVFACLW